MATRANANALYVLRLVLRGSPGAARRPFSAAVMAHRAAESPSTLTHGHGHSVGGSTAFASTSSASAASLSATASPPESDFLEEDEHEYAAAASFLPSRASGPSPSPIPWPTVFPHSPESSAPRPRPCDILARLVAENRLEPARKVYDELTALHTPIERRKLYLEPAVASLAPTAEGRAAFLFWLELYPNRPATRSSPDLKQTWHPIVARILNEHLDSTQFVADFLALAGKKGLLPAVLPLLLTPFATITPPHISEGAVESAIAAYRASTTSPTSKSARANALRSLTDSQIAAWWNRYLRSLALAGWTDSARALLYSPPAGVSWTRITRTVVLGQGLERREAALAAAQAREEAQRANPLLGLRREEAAPLPRRVRAAISGNRLPSVTELADVQAQLVALNRTRLLALVHRRFLRRDGAHLKSRTLPTVSDMWWWHAEIMRLSRAGEHAAAVAKFRDHFLWIGLPPLSTEGPPHDGTSPRLIPSIQVLTTVLTSILELENDAPAYYARYLSSLPRLPPTIKPTMYTHLAFIRAVAHQSGPGAAADALSAALLLGQDPGLPAWNALLLAYQTRGEVHAVFPLLSAMERREQLANGTAMPAPSARTYAGLIHTAARAGHMSQAQQYLQRFKRFINVSAAQGRKVTDEDKALLGEVKSVVRRGRERAEAAAMENKRATG